MLQNFAYYAQIMLHMQARILHKSDNSFLLSYIYLAKSQNHEYQYTLYACTYVSSK